MRRLTLNDTIEKVKDNAKRGINTPLLLIYALTITSQMVSLAFGRIDRSQDFSSIAVPSLVFLSVITLPSIWAGLILRDKIGFALLPGESRPPGSQLKNWSAPKASGVAILLGLSVGGLLVLVRHFSLPHLPAEIPAYGFRGVVGGLAVSFGAAVGEEVWFRLGLMTLLLWVLTKTLRSSEENAAIVWLVIAVSALGFGFAHLPQLLSYGAGSIFAVSGTILGNLTVGILYGWCYWRLGLSSAMLAHFSVDFVIHVLTAV